MKNSSKFRDFFLIFGAEHSLTESEVEKLDRIIHACELTDMHEIERVADFLVQKKLLQQPEEDVLLELKKNGFLI